MNEAEAEQVRALFRLYDELGCLGRVEEAAAVQGIRSKPRVTKTGQRSGEQVLTRGQILHLLTNVTYRGLTEHKAEAFPGLHPAIVDVELWDRVQARRQESSARPRGCRGRLAARLAQGTNPSLRVEPSIRHAPGEAAPLTGRLRDETGDRLTPTHSVKGERRLRYYTSHRLITEGADHSGWRLLAAELEGAVATVLAEHLERAADGDALLAEPDALDAEAHRAAALALVVSLRGANQQDDLLRRLVASGQIGPGRLSLALDGVA